MVIFEVQTGAVAAIMMAVDGSVVGFVMFMMQPVPTVTIGIVVGHVYQTSDTECCFQTLCGHNFFALNLETEFYCNFHNLHMLFLCTILKHASCSDHGARKELHVHVLHDGTVQELIEPAREHVTM